MPTNFEGGKHRYIDPVPFLVGDSQNIRSSRNGRSNGLINVSYALLKSKIVIAITFIAADAQIMHCDATTNKAL